MRKAAGDELSVEPGGSPIAKGPGSTNFRRLLARRPLPAVSLALLCGIRPAVSNVPFGSDHSPVPAGAWAYDTLFEFVRERDQARFRCEMWYRGDGGVEARVFKDNVLVMAQRFHSDVLAVRWADAERVEIERGSR